VKNAEMSMFRRLLLIIFLTSSLSGCASIRPEDFVEPPTFEYWRYGRGEECPVCGTKRVYNRTSFCTKKLFAPVKSVHYYICWRFHNWVIVEGENITTHTNILDKGQSNDNPDKSLSENSDRGRR